ncbi:MAG TPA: DMT family transporter [Pyrinomonadaceae bacterium]|nr:DMT family transporter [Pyrinomonadaceae bacterium]
MNKPSSSASPHIALIAVQVMFATWPVFGKIVLRTIPSLGLVGIRVLGAAVALTAIGLATRRLERIAKSDWLLLVVSSLLGVVLNQWLFVKGLSLTTAVNATLLGTTIPVFTLLVSIFVGNDRISARRIIGILLAGAGVVYLIGPDRASFSQSSVVGDLLLVLNSLCYGAYIAISKRLLSRYNALTVITWVFIVGCVPAVPVAAFSLSSVSFGEVPGSVWLAVGYIVLFATVVCYYLNSWALARVPPSTVAAYIYLQPLITFVLAPIVLGERVSSRVIIASLLVFAGVAVVTSRGRAKAIEEVSEHPEAFGH